MVAVEGDLRSPVGAVFNDLPDRVSDSLILIGARLRDLAGFIAYAPARLGGGVDGSDDRICRCSAAVVSSRRNFPARWPNSTGWAADRGAVAACFLPLYQAQWLFLIILWVITLGTLDLRAPYRPHSYG